MSNCTFRYALGIEYDGSHFHGWQQQEQLPTIQLYVEQALSRIANVPIQVTCAGRTDRGVHAMEQIVHFDSPVSRHATAWVRGGNTYLPPTIRVHWATQVENIFHARYSAVSRQYKYILYSAEHHSSILQARVGWISYPLSLSAMQQAAAHWIGKHDFTSFRGRHCQAMTPVREVHTISIRSHQNYFFFHILADAFLQHMVRIMVGTLIQIGRGKQKSDWAKAVLLARSRAMTRYIAPANGLYLERVHYPERYALPTIKHPLYDIVFVAH